MVRPPIKARLHPMFARCFKRPTPAQRSLISAFMADMEAESRKVWPAWLALVPA